MIYIYTEYLFNAASPISSLCACGAKGWTHIMVLPHPVIHDYPGYGSLFTPSSS